MLKLLIIENFALIDRLEVEFGAGLNLITGETGSGKSILVDAVSLLLGGRAFQETVREGFERARVEGLFEIAAAHPVRSRLEEAGIGVEGDQLHIRREILRSGGNKVFVQERLSTQGLLAELGELLADVHGQHDQQSLLRERTHLRYLDAFAAHGGEVEEVKRLYREAERLRSRLAGIRAGEKEREERLETLRFQTADIEKLGLRPGIEDELERERRLLATAERRLRCAEEGFQTLYEREEAVLGRLAQVERLLEELASLDETFGSTPARLRDARFQLEEVAFRLRDYSRGIEFQPGRLEAVQERLAEVDRARRRYGGSAEEILEYCERTRREIDELAHRGEEAGELEGRLRILDEDYARAARDLSQKRRAAALRLARRVERELAELAMGDARFEVDVRSAEDARGAAGIDRVEFLISANPGEAPRPLARIASGGELSRVVLALKSILTLEEYPKTLVFDEVDSGIGGRAATSVGSRLSRLAGSHQVFCVTHLAQIASFADRHFSVRKESSGDRTVVDLRPLNPSSRVEELARMLAGAAVSETTLRQARELLERRRAGPAEEVRRQGRDRLTGNKQP